MFFSHGSSHSRGVLILVREQLDFKLLSSKVDDQGRYILVHAMIQDTPFLLINIYAPNKCVEQSEFFKSISNEINTCVTLDCSIVLGGDFNDSFPPEWRAFAKSFTDSSLIEEIPNDPKIGLGNGNSVPILDVSAKQIYEIFF